MACLRHSSPSRVILGLPFRQDTGELATQHTKKKKIIRGGNPVLGRKVDWRRLLLHYENTEKNTSNKRTSNKEQHPGE